MKTISVALVLLLILVVSASVQDLGVAADVTTTDGLCNTKCQNRCSLKKAERCMGLCMMCCGRCAGCVPSGPYASKDECPCYRDMKSPKSGRPKCP